MNTMDRVYLRNHEVSARSRPSSSRPRHGRQARDLIAPGRDLGHSDADGDSDLAAAPPPDGFKWGRSSDGDDAPEPEPEPAPPADGKASKASWAVWRLLRVLRPERITDEARAEAQKLGLEDDE